MSAASPPVARPVAVNASARPPLGEFAWLVARDANKTIGSGMASIELLRRTLEGRGWLADGEHGVLNAVSRFTPGTNVLAYLAALGWSYHGPAGAIAAVMAGSIPGSAIVTMLTATAASVDRWRSVRAALAIATLLAAGLVLVSAWSLVRPFVRGPRLGWTLGSVALAALLCAIGATPVRVILALAVWGALTPGDAASRSAS
jgi:chromate transport protein ChrA